MATNKKHTDIQKGEVVQAVVIADSFDSKFGPLTTTRPRCLLQLANRPILSYTLDFLKISGVEECFVYCVSFHEDIKTYLKSWVANQGSNVMTINPIVNEECRSLGDAMRDLDNKGLLRQDFILVNGDTIGNVNLSNALKEHKLRCKEDKDATMTLAYRKAFPGHHMRTIDDEVFVVINDDKRILHHVRPGKNENNFKVPLEVFESDDTIDLKFDLMDPGIAICSQAVPPLFQDHFDVQSLDDFVKEILQNDLTTNKLHLYEFDDDKSYASRIINFHTYFAAQLDVLHRWLHPIVPEFSSGKDISSICYGRHNIYKSSDVKLAKGSVLEEDVLLGKNVYVGEKSTLHQAIIGANCQIGKNVSIRNCIIYDNVIIGDNCQLVDSVIGKSVSLGKDVIIHEKCVFGDSVQIQEKTDIPQETWLVSEKPSSGFSDDEDEDDESIYGAKAILYQDVDACEDSDDDVEEISSKWGQIRLDDNISDTASTISSASSEIENDIDMFETDDDANFRKFNNEVFESLERGHSDGVKVDNLVLEINSSRHAYAVTQSQVVQSVVTSILQLGASQLDGNESSAKKLLIEVKKMLKMFVELLLKYVKTSGAQVDCLKALESVCLEESHFLPIIAKVIEDLHDKDILSEEAIVKWFRNICHSNDVKARVQPFIDWLLAEDSEDDEDESDDE